MLEEVPYSELVTVTPHSPEEIIAHGEEIGVLRRTAHPLGDVLSVSDADTAVLLSYFRNNVLHLFTASAWIACCFQHNRRMARRNLLRSEEHTSELQSLMRISYAVFCLKKKKK